MVNVVIRSVISWVRKLTDDNQICACVAMVNVVL